MPKPGCLKRGGTPAVRQPPPGPSEPVTCPARITAYRQISPPLSRRSPHPVVSWTCWLDPQEPARPRHWRASEAHGSIATDQGR